MINDVFKASASTMISFLFTYGSLKNLWSYSLKNNNDTISTFWKASDIINANPQEKMVFLLSIFAALISITLCILTIKYLVSQFRDESSSLVIIGFIIWITLLVLDILVSLYTLLFLVIIITFGLILLLASAGAAVNGTGGGSVHVRGHYRNGSYVRSHTRRRPKHF